MAALTQDRNTPQAIGDIEGYDVKAGTTIYGGAIACLDATGYVVPGATATTLTAIGRAEHRADNAGGADGDIKARVRRGVFRFENSAAADEIDATHIGGDCYIVDDQTVAATDGTATRSVAGTVVQVDAQGVWVRTGIF